MQRERLIRQWRSLALLTALAIICAFAFVADYVLTVRTTPGRILGNASLRGAMLTHSRTTEVIDAVLGVVSIASLFAIVSVVAVISLVRRRRSEGLAAVGLLAAANISAWSLKNAALSRPNLGLHELTPATLNSLPSGHTTAAFSAVVALVFVMPRAWRPATATVGACYAGLTALATMSAGWHRAGDSIAAFLLVGVWAAFAGVTIIAFDEADPPPGRWTRPTWRYPWWPVRTASGTILAGLILAATIYATGVRGDSRLVAIGAFAAGGLLIAGSTIVILCAALWILDLASPPQTKAHPHHIAAPQRSS